jgi:adenosylmethionine-8-amino-7-oxononanoate aminotransferase
VDHVRRRGDRLRGELADALAGIPIVGEVRGHGFLLGVEYSHPADKVSFLPPELRVAARIDETAMANGLLVLSTQPTRDGYAGDQSLFAPPFTTPEETLAAMVESFADSVRIVSKEVEAQLSDLDPVPKGPRQ